MGVKEDSKLVINSVFGPATASKVDAFPDTPKECIDKVEELIGKFIGPTRAKEKVASLRTKYPI